MASWLNPSLAAHIEQAGLFTLAQLIDHINGIGRLWYGSIPALGTAKAGLVVAWLGEHQASIGRAVGRHIVRARTELMRSELDAVVAPASDIRPLEKFIVPAELDGRHRRPDLMDFVTTPIPIRRIPWTSRAVLFRVQRSCAGQF